MIRTVMKPHLILLIVFVLKHQLAHSHKCEIPENDEYANCVVSKNLKDYNIKTVQGEFYSFKSDCLYTLLSYESDDGDQISINSANSKVEIVVGAKQYELKVTGKNQFVFATPDKIHKLPVSVGKIDVSKPGVYAVAKFKNLGLTVKWNGQESVVIQLDNAKQYDLSGICSKDCLESTPSLREQWKLTDKCVDEESGKCLTVQDRSKSLQYCRTILRNKKYNKCLKALNVDSFLSECQAVFCNCKKPKVEMCMCELFDSFIKHCEARTGEAISWREKNFCEKKCKIPNQVYVECGRRQKACGEVVENDKDDKTCIEGCRCPLNLFLSNQKCITAKECPCRYENVDYAAGSKSTQDCNTCVCNGNDGWDCTTVCLSKLRLTLRPYLLSK
nr:von Willebrand factor-like [Onthophagus taurus]